MTRRNGKTVYTIDCFYALRTEILPDSQYRITELPVATADPDIVRVILLSRKTRQQANPSDLRIVPPASTRSSHDGLSFDG